LIGSESVQPVQWWDFNLTFVLSVVFLAGCEASDSATPLISVFVLDGEKRREERDGGGGAPEREREREREKNIGFLSNLKGHNLSCSDSQF